MTTRRWAAVLSILLFAFLVRMIALNARPVWYDEAFTVLLSEKSLSAIMAGSAADTMPPLYFLALHYWMLLVGDTPLAARMLSVAFSMLSLAVVYAAGTRGLGRAAGAWGALLAAAAPFQIYYGQELRMYSILALAGALYVYAVMRLDEPSAWSVAFIAATTSFALYSHNLAFLTLFAGNVYCAVKRDWRREMRLLVGQVLGALIFFPWLLFVPGQVDKVARAFWTKPPSAVDILQMFMMFTTHLPLVSVSVAIALFVTLAAVTIGALELWRIARRRPRPGVSLWLCFLLVPPVLMFLTSYVLLPIFVPRGVIVSSLAYYVLLGALAARTSRLGRIGVVAVLAVILLICYPALYGAWGEWRRAPFAEADRFLRDHIRPGDRVLQDNKLAFYPMYYYDRTLPQDYIADPAGSDNDTLAPGSQAALELFPVDVDRAIGEDRTVWFVIFQTALDQAAEEGHPHGNASRLDAALRPIQVTSFGDLRIYEYAPR